MDDVIKMLTGLLALCKNECQNEYSERVMAAIHNSTIMNLELIDHYMGFWKDTVSLSTEDIERCKRENWERILELEKWMLFIPAISILEHELRKLILHTRGNEPEGLEDALNFLKVHGILTKGIVENIKYMNYLRHDIVHNNGIGLKDRRENEICGYKLKIEKGKMTKSNLKMIVKFVEYIAHGLIEMKVR